MFPAPAFINWDSNTKVLDWGPVPNAEEYEVWHDAGVSGNYILFGTFTDTHTVYDVAGNHKVKSRGVGSGDPGLFSAECEVDN